MNLGLEAFLAIFSLYGSGLFTAFAVYGQTQIRDQKGNITTSLKNQYAYGFFAFLTFVIGVCLILDAFKLI